MEPRFHLRASPRRCKRQREGIRTAALPLWLAPARENEVGCVSVELAGSGKAEKNGNSKTADRASSCFR
ncbi:hypothetical protein SLE2022_348700 [Rubroshorea leprosula]